MGKSRNTDQPSGLSDAGKRRIRELLTKQNTSDPDTGRRENGLDASEGQELQDLLRRAEGKGINPNG